ncbi:hypothetical protein ACFE04_009210 [Oxalis oulophora]
MANISRERVRQLIVKIEWGILNGANGRAKEEEQDGVSVHSPCKAPPSSASSISKEHAQVEIQLRLLEALEIYPPVKLRVALLDYCLDGNERLLVYEKGDYFRYLSEFKTDQQRKDDVDQSLKGYEAASEIASKELPPTHPIRFGRGHNRLQLLRDNLTLWTSDLPKDGGTL